MANIVSKKTVRKGSKSKVFVIEKFGPGVEGGRQTYGVGRYQYGGLSFGWKPFRYLRDARRHMDKIVKQARES